MMTGRRLPMTAPREKGALKHAENAKSPGSVPQPGKKGKARRDDSDGKQQMIYKHAISTVVPVRPLPLEAAESGF